jgi:hypothetical protein
VAIFIELKLVEAHQRPMSRASGFMPRVLVEIADHSIRRCKAP